MYRLVLRGELGDQFGFLFAGMRMSREGGTTVLIGPVADQVHLAGIIDRTQELGLELISVGPLDEARGVPRTRRDRPAACLRAYARAGRVFRGLGPLTTGERRSQSSVMASSRGAIGDRPAPAGSPPVVGLPRTPSSRPAETAEPSADTDRAVLVETKLQAPRVRDQMVGRDHLLERRAPGPGSD